MHIDRGLLNWGVFLIALGGVPLAAQQGWMESSLLSDLWRLWPLILVGVGLGLILRWTPIAWLGGALVAGTFGLILGALFASGISGISSACLGVGEDASETSRSGAASESAFRLDIALSCGQLRVGRGASATWSVDAVHAEGLAPTISGSTTGLDVSQSFSADAFLVFSQKTRNDWTFELPAASALSVEMTLNVGDGSVDLGIGPLELIDGTFNASDIALDLQRSTALEATVLDLVYNASSGRLALPRGSVLGEITLNASSLRLCLPDGAEARVVYDDTLSSHDLGSAGLSESGGTWTTSGYETATDRIDLVVASTVSSLDVERAEVCE